MRFIICKKCKTRMNYAMIDNGFNHLEEGYECSCGEQLGYDEESDTTVSYSMIDIIEYQSSDEVIPACIKYIGKDGIVLSLKDGTNKSLLSDDFIKFNKSLSLEFTIYNKINRALLEGLTIQLKKEGACAFKNSGYYYNVYKNEEKGGYSYDKYESMQDSEPLVSESCECDKEEDAILFSIE